MFTKSGVAMMTNKPIVNSTLVKAKETYIFKRFKEHSITHYNNPESVMEKNLKKTQITKLNFQTLSNF